MEKIKAVFLEMDLKAANSSNAYELIMNLLTETSSKLQASGVNGRLLFSGVIGKSEDRGQ